jgi:peptide/nickel transport system ATP-binding protein
MITHDLGVVAEIADRVLIMYAGSVSELGPTEAVLQHPLHPYTAGLLGSLPRIDLPRQDRLEAIPGSPPSMLTLPTGCAFHPRCSIREESAGWFTRQPGLEAAGPGRSVRCHLALASQPGAPSNDEVRS